MSNDRKEYGDTCRDLVNHYINMMAVKNRVRVQEEEFDGLRKQEEKKYKVILDKVTAV